MNRIFNNINIDDNARKEVYYNLIQEYDKIVFVTEGCEECNTYNKKDNILFVGNYESNQDNYIYDKYNILARIFNAKFS